MQKIYIEPIKEIIKKIDNSNKKTIFLVGDIGTGKTVVLNEFENSNYNDIIVDVGLGIDEYQTIIDKKIYDLYYIVLMCYKILDNIKENHKEIFLMAFSNYYKKINYLISEINIMRYVQKFDNKQKYLSKELLDNPEIILEELIIKINKIFKDRELILIVDDFDKSGSSSMYYQHLIAKLFNKYSKMILTISDINSFKYCEKNLKLYSDIIEVNYSDNPDNMTIIINNMIINEYPKRDAIYIRRDTIINMIYFSNGNINIMLQSVRNLLRYSEFINESDYDIYLINNIKEMNCRNTVITGITNETRKLHIR